MRWRHPAAGYLLAVLVQLVVAVISRLLIQFVPTYSFPGVLEILAVAFIATNWGIGPGVLSAFVGLVLEETFVLPAFYGEGQFTAGDLVEAALFMAIGICFSLVASTTERAKRKAVEEKAAAQARESALRQTQERMDEFVAIASHDLRSPLSAALGFNQIATVRYERLAAAVLDTRPELEDQIETVRRTLEEARESVERMWRLVDLLFDTAQMRAGTIELQRLPCDLAALVHDQIVALRVANPRRTLDLQVPGEGSVQVKADANRIGQVVANYVTNALKYSPADQPVAVRVAHNGTWACVAVEDHGPGLPASEQEAIWGRFYRVVGVRAQSGSGTTGMGLGLHICKALIEGHGGQVGVESEVGKGSTFWFTLLLADGRS
jgi:signal transduction histidine kinase